MSRSRPRLSAPFALLAAAGLFAPIAPPAEAVSAGTPGPIAYVRDQWGGGGLVTLADGGVPVPVPGTAGAHGFRWSPDGKVLAFEIWEGGIYLVNPDGSGLRRLFTPAAGEKFGAPVWSPDGRRMAFAVLSPGDGAFHIEIADTLQGERTVLDVAVEYISEWLPDGTMLAAADSDLLPFGNYEDLVAIAPDGSTRWLTRTAHQSENVARVSPDGRTISFVSHRFEPGAPYPDTILELMNVDGTNRRVLHNLGDQVSWPAWSPDGREIAVGRTKDRPGARPNAIRVDGSGVRPLTGEYGIGDGLDWAPATTTTPIPVAGMRALALPDPSVKATTWPSSAWLWPYVDGYKDSVAIRQRLDEPAWGTVELFNSAGSVTSRHRFKLMTGMNTWRWNGRWASGRIAPAGRYRIDSIVRDLSGRTVRTTFYVTVRHGRP